MAERALRGRFQGTCQSACRGERRLPSEPFGRIHKERKSRAREERDGYSRYDTHARRFEGEARAREEGEKVKCSRQRSKKGAPPVSGVAIGIYRYAATIFALRQVILLTQLYFAFSKVLFLYSREVKANII